jgi:ribosomal protein S18 acetylase RimI-like enzyme
MLCQVAANGTSLAPPCLPIVGAVYPRALITYTASAEAITGGQLRGFFVGWPVVPSPEQHLELLHASHAVELALDGDAVVGFVTAISDGVVSAFIPLLEVLPKYQHQRIGTELVRRLLGRLDDLYMVDLCCDADLEPFYRSLGFQTLDLGMGIRRRENI